MEPSHATPFLGPDVVIPGPPLAEVLPDEASLDCCDYCSARRLAWRKCKLVCLACLQINKSCADL